MKVFNLQCEFGHGFEGWFGSEEDFHAQVASAMLECPLCSSKAVRRLPSAPRLNLSSASSSSAVARAANHAESEPIVDVVSANPAKPAALEAPPTPQHQAVQALWMKAVQHVLANTDDVGPRFADEARRIHYGEAEPRGIRGQTTADEKIALHEEGIDVFTMPMPAAVKGTLQ
jgi:hypothetical protein